MRRPERWRASEGVQRAARDLRRDATPAEEALWEAIRRGQLHGLRFRRQHPVHSFVLDFYCPTKRLAIEVDGGVHDRRAYYDSARTEALATINIRVLRFRNEQVLNDLAAVLARIAEAADTA